MSDSVDDDQPHRPTNKPTHPGETGAEAVIGRGFFGLDADYDGKAETTIFDFIDDDPTDAIVFDVFAGYDGDGDVVTWPAPGDDNLFSPDDGLAG